MFRLVLSHRQGKHSCLARGVTVDVTLYSTKHMLTVRCSASYCCCLCVTNQLWFLVIRHPLPLLLPLPIPLPRPPPFCYSADHSQLSSLRSFVTQRDSDIRYIPLPCIVIDFLLNNQRDALIIQIYSVIKLYMFRASSVPIIRSFQLYIRHW